MHRTEGDGFVVVGGKNQFTEGDPFIPTPATMVTADWANAIQEEIALAVEGLGGTLETAATDTTPNQLLTQLNAKFGRLDLVNSWAAAQTFAGGVTGPMAVTGAVTVSTTLGVTGATTLGGTTTVNATLNASAGGEALMVKPASADHAYIGFYPRTSTPTTRLGYFGFSNTASTAIDLLNAIPSGDINLSPGAGGVVNTSGNVVLTGANPASSTAFTDTVTPANVVKAWAIVGNATGTVTLTDGFNVTSAVNNGAGTLVITLASPMASGTYAVVGNAGAQGWVYGASQTTTTFQAIVTVGSGAKSLASYTDTITIYVMGRQ